MTTIKDTPHFKADHPAAQKMLSALFASDRRWREEGLTLEVWDSDKGLCLSTEDGTVLAELRDGDTKPSVVEHDYNYWKKWNG